MFILTIVVTKTACSKRNSMIFSTLQYVSTYTECVTTDISVYGTSTVHFT